MRDSIKNIGLILALVIAGVSLPIGIIGFNRSAEAITICNTTIIEQYNITFYTLTVYNIRREWVIIDFSMEEGNVFSYSVTQEHYEREYIYVFALTSEQFKEYETDSPFPSMAKFYLGRSYFGAGYYQVNSTDVWYFGFFTYEWIEYLTITYTVWS